MKKQETRNSAVPRGGRVTPEFRENPDIEKLARALIAITKGLAEKKAAEEAGREKYR